MNKWDYSIFWKETLQQLKTEFKNEGKEHEFNLWFNIEYFSSGENTIIISVPSSFYRDQLKERRYIAKIEAKLLELSGQKIIVDFNITANANRNANVEEKSNNDDEDFHVESKKESAPTLSTEKPKKSNENHPLLRADYTFDSFVTGNNSAFAYNAGIAVAKNPGSVYNPYLIYGGVGLGKTHLMQAIGNLFYAEKGGKLIYITAENFTNEFIQSIQTNTTAKFKNKYRSVDILLIDDIHFLQKKIETQEELFHTFNALYDSYKQMVFTCDRPVSEMKNLSDRLRSRFERGLNVDLQPPDYETRRAILSKKMENKSIKIPPEVIDLIARNIATNVRDLEASLTKLLAYSELVNKNLTLEIAQQQLRDSFGSPKQANITIENIQKVVADYFGISFLDLKGKKRTRNIVLPRQLAMYIAKELTEYSTTELGREFGGRDHTTVMHSCQKIEESMKSDPTLDSTVQILMRSVKDYKK